MSKFPFPFVFLCILSVSLLTACKSPPTPVPVTQTETPVPTASSTVAVTLVPIFLEVAAPQTPTPKFAQFCDTVAESTQMAVQCYQPIAEQSSAFCEKKAPYNLILMNASASYQLFDERFQCSNAGMKDGRKQVTCTGPMGITFDVKVCDPACILPVYNSAVTYCPQEYTFNSQRSCCARTLEPEEYHCVLLHLETKRCSINCRQFTGEAACYENFYACEWDEENKLCKSRK